MTFVALLRGINLGPANRISMKDLIALFEEAGCVSVRHFIQSGNVIFKAPAKVAKGLPAAIPARIHGQFGFNVPVIVRSAAEFDEAIRNNPFLTAAMDVNTLHLMCLRDEPDPDRIELLDPDRSPPDKFVVVGREVYLHLPNGLGRSKLTNAWFDGKLKTVSTVRNWRTVMKLQELMLN